MPTASISRSTWPSNHSTDGIGKLPRPVSTRRISAVTAPRMHHALRLTVDRTAIQENWRWLQNRAGAPAGAAVKANAYGLGAREASHALYQAGCRDFFVSTWAEVEGLGPLPLGASLVVLHGIGPKDPPAALESFARPCLNSLEQVA